MEKWKEELFHAGSHKYIDRYWKDGEWHYIYHDPSNNETTTPKPSEEPRVTATRSKKPSVQENEKEEDTRMRKVVTYYNSTGFGRSSMDSSYLADDPKKRRYYLRRDKNGRLVKRYLDE